MKLATKKIKSADSCMWESKKSLPEITRALTIEMIDEACEVIGYIDLVETKTQNTWETHVHLDESFRNQGLGIILYDKAISTALKRGWCVVSSDVTSKAASRVWCSKRLNEKYIIEKIGELFIVRGIRNNHVNKANRRSEIIRQSRHQVSAPQACEA